MATINVEDQRCKMATINVEDQQCKMATINVEDQQCKIGSNCFINFENKMRTSEANEPI
jgi:hypothetical protein